MLGNMSTMAAEYTNSRMKTTGSQTNNKGFFIKSSPVCYKNLKFVLFDAPTDSNINLYAEELLQHKVTAVVRLCEPTYDKSYIEKLGMRVYDWPFADGEPPPPGVTKSWLSLVHEVFGTPTKYAPRKKKKDSNSTRNSSQKVQEAAQVPESPTVAIGVHCVAGLGRAPILVAIALVEAGMSPLDSVIHVRECRRGAINARQLKYIENYKRNSKSRMCRIL